MDANERVRQRDPTEIDLEILAFVRSSAEGGFYDPVDGEVYLTEMGQVITGDDDDVDPDERDWIHVDGDDSQDACVDMSDFSAAVSDPVLSDRLMRALHGRGAFRRFRDTVDEEGDAFSELWYTFSGARTQARAIKWLLRNELCQEAQAVTAIAVRNTAAEGALAQAGQWTRSAR